MSGGRLHTVVVVVIDSVDVKGKKMKMKITYWWLVNTQWWWWSTQVCVGQHTVVVTIDVDMWWCGEREEESE